MPDTKPDETQLALVEAEVNAVTEAVRISLGVKELTIEYGTRKLAVTTTALALTKPPQNDDEQQMIIVARDGVQSLRTQLVKSGENMKGPLNTVRARIIDYVKNEESALKKVEDHCNGLINAYQRKLEEARIAAAAAAEREEKKKQEAEAEAERQRIEAENAAKAAEEARIRAEQAKGAGAKKAQAEADRLAKEARDKDDAAFEAQVHAAAIQAPVAMVPVSSNVAKKVYDFTLAGDNDREKAQSLLLLFKSKPQFFGIDIKEDKPRHFRLVLKINDLGDAINGRPPFTQITECPGIVIIEQFAKVR